MKFAPFVILLLFIELFTPFTYAAPASTTSTINQPNTATTTTTNTNPATTGTTTTIAPATTTGTGTVTTTGTVATGTTGTVSAPTNTPITTTSGLAACPAVPITDADRNRFWQNTIGFQGNELNSLPVADALSAKKADDPLSKDYKLLQQETEDTITIKDLAVILSTTPKDIAEKARIPLKNGVPEKDSVSEEDAQQLAELVAREKGKSSADGASKLVADFLGEINKKVVKIPKKTITGSDLDPFEKYKIRLPGTGTEMTLGRLLRLNNLDGKSCSLPEKYFGSVTYQALLDDDMVYANSESDELKSGKITYPPTGEKQDLGKVNQHLISSSGSTTGLLSLNGGSNLIIPSFYEYWVATVGEITFYDFLLSGVVGLGVFWSSSQIGKEIAEKEKEIATRFASQNGRVNQNAELIKEVGESLTKVRGQVAVSGLSAGEQSTVNKFVAKAKDNSLIFAEDALHAAKGTPAGDEAALMKTVLDKYSKNEALDATEASRLAGILGVPVTDVPGSLPGAVSQEIGQLKTAATNQLSNTAASLDEKALRNEVDELTKRGKNYAEAAKALSGRITYSLFIGGVWQGPIRLAFSKNTELYFRLNNKEKEQFVRVQVNKAETAKAFRSATDIFGLGSVQEIIGSYTGGGAGLAYPAEAFSVGKMVLINKPTNQQAIPTSSSLTVFSKKNGSIITQWKGVSDSVNFEDVKDLGSKAKFARMPLISYETFPDVALDRAQEAKFLGYLARFGLSWIIYRDLASAGAENLALPIPLLINRVLIQQNLDQFNGQNCKTDVIQAYRNEYIAATIFGIGANFLPVMKQQGILKGVLSKGLMPTTAGKNFISLDTAINVINLANIPEAVKVYLSARAVQYTSSCVDPQHRILAFQAVPDAFKKKAAAPNQVEDLLSKLKLPSTTEDTFKTPEASQLAEIINFKAVLEDQKGVITPEGLKYLHLEKSAFATGGALFKTLEGEGCTLPENIVGGNALHRFDADGKYCVHNKDGSVRTCFDDEAWKIRASARFTAQELGRVIIPNKFVDARLDGTGNVFVDVSSDGRITHVDAISCDLSAGLEQVLGYSVGNDLTKAIGKAVTVETTEGIGIVQNGEIRFVKDTGIVGNEVTYPNAAEKKTQANSVLKSYSLQVLGNGQVLVKGPAGKQESLGQLKTILGENGKGRIDYDSNNNRLVIFVYTMFQGHISQLAGVVATPGDKGIKLEAKAKPGQEEEVAKLNKALEKIQGADGLGILENKDHIYDFTQPGKLRVIDKKTGKVKEYNINGQITKDGNSITVPTDQGPFKFTFDTNNGKLNLGVDGPDGLKELLPLLKAAGPQGILTFNPTTGGVNVYNGQDIPLNPDFASKGISYSQSDQGVRGYPADNPFILEDKTKSGSGDSSKLLLPSWPENPFFMLIMLLAILAGAVAVRKDV